MDRVFLDANVLFSAAWSDSNALRRLWAVPQAQVLSSPYAVEEARRNLDSAERLAQLQGLMKKVELIVETLGPLDAVAEARLPVDDRPILRAAMAGRATHLLSGDLRAFGPFFGRRLGGVRVLRPAAYLQRVGR